MRPTVTVFLALAMAVGPARAGVISSVLREAAEGATRAAAIKSSAAGVEAAQRTVTANTNQAITLNLYTDYASTKGFTKFMVMSLAGYTIENDRKQAFVLESVLHPGQKKSLFGRSWVAVYQTGQGKVGLEKVKVALTVYYDPKTNLTAHILDDDDDSITSYDWSNRPDKVRLGEVYRIGNITEKDKSGKVLADGHVELRANKIDSFVEICEMERVIKKASERSETNSMLCVKFREPGVPISAKLEIAEGGKVTSSLEGPIRIKDKH